MKVRKNLAKDTYLVKYSANDGRNYGVMAVSYCHSEDHAIKKTKRELMKTNPKAAGYSYAAARD